MACPATASMACLHRQGCTAPSNPQSTPLPSRLVGNARSRTRSNGSPRERSPLGQRLPSRERLTSRGECGAGFGRAGAVLAGRITPIARESRQRQPRPGVGKMPYRTIADKPGRLRTIADDPGQTGPILCEPSRTVAIGCKRSRIGASRCGRQRFRATRSAAAPPGEAGLRRRYLPKRRTGPAIPADMTCLL